MQEQFVSYYKSLDLQQREELIFKLRALLEPKPELIFAYVYGSFLSSMPFQDIDLALYVDPDPSQETRDLEERYAVLLDQHLKEIFHVVIVNHAPNPLLCSIFSEGRKLFCKDMDLLTDLIEQVSLDMLANEGIARQCLQEIVP